MSCSYIWPVLINHNQEIIALGGEANWNTFSIFLDHYDANTATYDRHVYHDSLKMEFHHFSKFK